MVPPSLAAGHPLLLGHQLVEEQQDGRGGVDRHRRGDLVEGQTAQQDPHVVDGVDGHADLAHLALGPGVVGVVAHLGRQVEGARKPGPPAGEQQPPPLVGGLRRPETGILPDRPRPAPVHGRVDAAGVREGPGGPQPLPGVPAGQVGVGVDRLDLDAGIGAARLVGHGPRLNRFAIRGAEPHPEAAAICSGLFPAQSSRVEHRAGIVERNHDLRLQILVTTG